jgi:cytochrome b561
MSIGFIFWLLMILWLLFGLYWNWPKTPEQKASGVGALGGNLLLFILLFLLGWKTFGFIIQG